MNALIDPAKYALADTEAAHQTALFIWSATPEVRQKYPELRWLFAIPNGGFRDKITAARLKAQGVKPGVPDVCLPIRRGKWAGLWIEMKRPKTEKQQKGTVRVEQSIWLDFLATQGYGTAICRGWDQARLMLINYLEYDKHEGMYATNEGWK